MGADTENIYDEAFIQNIIKKLNYYTKLYDEGIPEISDKEWDDLYFKLVKMEQATGIYLENSPTQKISYTLVNQLDKIEHNHPMLSLDKTKDIDIVKSFINNKRYIAMLKMDGLTCSLTYRNGYLIKAETRGNGIIGENILHNALQVKNIPNRIENIDEVIVDGEIICKYDDFEEFKNEYKNPRNFASGSIRLLDSQECSKRKLSFIAWDCIKGISAQTLTEKLFTLRGSGFTTVPFQWGDSIEDNIVEHSIEELKNIAKELKYPIDGIVFKYDNVNEYLAAGRTDHHFKGGIAYKFYDEQYETTLKDIEWTMGRTGQLTPVAIFEPVEIDGTLVEKASLHNISIMEKILYKPYIGQKISVVKMNQIIPQITDAIWNSDEYDTLKNGLFIPTECPICHNETVVKQENDSKILFCNNSSCEGKLLNRLDHFCSKKGLDIKGLSKATLEKLVDWGWINTYQDIFLLYQYKDRWIKKSGFGEASVNKILNAIEEAKNTTLDRIIAAAGIPEIGSRVAKDLSNHYNSWNDFRNEKDFLQYDGIGEVMNNNLLTFNYDDLNLDYTINRFLSIKNENKNDENVKTLDGKTFCITGKVHIFKNRSELQKDIESKGGRVVSSISSKVDYLINNDNASTSAKNIAAQKAGIPIITEEEYQSLY